MDTLIQLIQDTITDHQGNLDCHVEDLGCSEDWLTKAKSAIAIETLTQLLIDFEASTDADTRRPNIGPVVRPLAYASGGKDWSLDSNLKPTDIDRLLGCNCRVDDDPYKVKFSWAFTVDGMECAIWDYRGIRWSGMGPREAFDKLGIKIES